MHIIKIERGNVILQFVKKCWGDQTPLQEIEVKHSTENEEENTETQNSATKIYFEHTVTFEIQKE